MNRENETPENPFADFDVHDDARNLEAASVNLNILCFVAVAAGSCATCFLLDILVVPVAITVLIVSTSATAKGLAKSALLAVGLLWLAITVTSRY